MMIDMDEDNNYKLRDVLVITDHNTQSGGRAANDRYWTVTKGIVARYEYQSDKVIEEKATIIWREEGSSNNWKIELKPETIYRLKVRSLKKNEYGYPDMSKDVMRLYDVLDCYDENESLMILFNEYIGETVIEDEELGTFSYKNGSECYSRGQLEWLGYDIDVKLESRDGDKDEGLIALSHFKDIYNSKEEYDIIVREYAAKNTTDVVNELNYRTYAEYTEYEEISMQEFYNRIILKMISIRADGRYRFYFDDDDMFWGRLIMVEGDMENGITGTDVVVA